MDFNSPDLRTVFGVEVPVMPLEKLLEYKRRLDRPVDREDVEALDGPELTHADEGEGT